ncbi:hypothetical protein OROGR_006019 [Orobanche gracilis]
MAAASRLSATILILSILLFATSTTGCGTCVPKPNPKPAPYVPPLNYPFCPRDTLKLGVCADLLGLINVQIGTPPSGYKCCALLQDLADLEVAACLCTAIKANVLGINLNVPVALSALVSSCGKTIPTGFKCG